MLGICGITPIAVFRPMSDSKGVCDYLPLADGTFWPIPITLSVDASTADAIAEGSAIALGDPDTFFFSSSRRHTRCALVTEVQACALPFWFLVTKDPADWKAFATPSLREVAATAPYMHNGALPNLEEVIEFYDRGGGGDPKKSPLLKPLGLSKEEKESLREFLVTGLSGKMPGVRPPAIP